MNDFAFIDLVALFVGKPTNVLNGDPKLYRQCKKLLNSLDENMKIIHQIMQTVERWPGVGSLSDHVRAKPAFRAQFEISEALRAYMHELKLQKTKGKPKAYDFIISCCGAAETVERTTGVPIFIHTRINPRMIDIVTELMRNVPLASRLNPTVNPDVDRHPSDPERKGVAEALRKGRKTNQLS